jgi:hypothetical protein
LAVELRSSDQQLPLQPSQQKQQQPTGKNTHHNTNQISSHSVQAKNININATDAAFIAFTVVQQIMTELFGAAIEKEKFAVITKAVFRLLKSNANNSS